MTSTPEDTPNEEESQPSPLEKLFESPEVRRGLEEFLKQSPAVLQAWINSGVQKETVKVDSQVRSTRWTSGAVLLVTVLVTIAIILAVSFLAWGGKMSAEATAFLFGTIIGTVFGILGRFSGGRF